MMESNNKRISKTEVAKTSITEGGGHVVKMDKDRDKMTDNIQQMGNKLKSNTNKKEPFETTKTTRQYQKVAIYLKINN